MAGIVGPYGGVDPRFMAAMMAAQQQYQVGMRAGMPVRSSNFNSIYGTIGNGAVIMGRGIHAIDSFGNGNIWLGNGSNTIVDLGPGGGVGSINGVGNIINGNIVRGNSVIGIGPGGGGIVSSTDSKRQHFRVDGSWPVRR